MSLVFFDFDKTLTTRDTIFPLGMFLSRAQRRRVFKVACLLLLMFGLKLRVLSNHRFKRAFCDTFLKNESEKEIAHLSRVFAERYVGPILNTNVVEALRDHQRKGDEVYLVSSNFAFLLREMQHQWNARGIIATEPEAKAGRFTGRLTGRACDGPEKLSRVVAQFGLKQVGEATAYGDSRGDCQLLASVKTAVWV